MKEGTCCTQAVSRLCLRTQIPSVAVGTKESLFSHPGLASRPPASISNQDDSMQQQARHVSPPSSSLHPTRAQSQRERDWRKSARPSSLVGCVIHAIHIHYGHAHHAHARRVLARARRQRRRTNESIFANDNICTATATTVAHAQRS